MLPPIAMRVSPPGRHRAEQMQPLFTKLDWTTIVENQTMANFGNNSRFGNNRRGKQMTLFDSPIDRAIQDVVKSPTMTAEEKTKIIQALAAAAPADRWGVNRWVISGLIFAVGAAVIGMGVAWGIALSRAPNTGLTNFAVPEGLIALATGALGALAAYLVPPTHTPATSAPGAAPAPGPAPVVTAISPANGGAGGGTTVTVTGSGFTGATAVQFGANSATPTDVSDTQITATSPAGNGEVDVRVVTPAGTSAISPAAKFTYN